MAISIAILGASGSVGTALGAHLLRSGLLERQDRIQLVGHGNPKSDARLLATRIDLLDAFNDQQERKASRPHQIYVEATAVWKSRLCHRLRISMRTSW